MLSDRCWNKPAASTVVIVTVIVVVIAVVIVIVVVSYMKTIDNDLFSKHGWIEWDSPEEDEDTASD